MSFVPSWYTVDEAASKYGVGRDIILRWVEEGLVRCETEHQQVVRVNVDDVEMNVRELIEEDR